MDGDLSFAAGWADFAETFGREPSARERANHELWAAERALVDLEKDVETATARLVAAQMAADAARLVVQDRRRVRDAAAIEELTGSVVKVGHGG